MESKQAKRIRGFTLLEALVTITLGSLIMLGVFHSSFTANRATAQTEQTLEAENLLSSRLAGFLSEAATLSVPYSETELILTKSAEYTLTKTLANAPGRPNCAHARLVLTWKQGRLNQSRDVECLLPYRETSGLGP
ncbi:MAG: prepilin-type N-terminal cleavage/methylation domain-containing protein [Vulcanimicrobiota bacterium]